MRLVEEKAVSELGILSTKKGCGMLGEAIRKARVEGLGWAQAEMCMMLERGKGPRKANCAAMLDRMLRDFSRA